MPQLTIAKVARLPEYYQILKMLSKKGREHVSSEHLAEVLGIDSSLVRKDLAWAYTGVQKVGYHIPATVKKIEEVLGLNNTKDAFLVGAGSLGQALMGYTGFREYGLSILAAFDIDQEKVGQKIGDTKVFPMSEFDRLARRLNIQMGIVAVTEDAAQQVADQMVEAGFKALWNFAPVFLKLPDDILVRNENLAGGFAMLGYELERSV